MYCRKRTEKKSDKRSIRTNSTHLTRKLDFGECIQSADIRTTVACESTSNTTNDAERGIPRDMIRKTRTSLFWSVRTDQQSYGTPTVVEVDALFQDTGLRGCYPYRHLDSRVFQVKAEELLGPVSDLTPKRRNTVRGGLDGEGGDGACKFAKTAIVQMLPFG